MKKTAFWAGMFAVWSSVMMLKTAHAQPQAGQPWLTGGEFGAVVGVSQQPTLNFAYLLDPGIFIGPMLGFKYDQDGITTGSNKKVALSFGVRIAYFMINSFPFAAGPEVGYLTRAIGGQDAFDQHEVTPGFAFYYAPWAAKVAIGAAWMARFSFFRGSQGETVKGDKGPEIDLLTGEIRFLMLWS